eukprot:TRINITY_DN13301_c0_g1_i2.p1 TRINITY_DN13301_c0_g1~~TRINITY_DN13301_c0_g1_i2.p1  ORF type:complete len:922 (-),score=136.05 TRINITY_DN13301_c0_g1_i2:38-2803(-)
MQVRRDGSRRPSWMPSVVEMAPKPVRSMNMARTMNASKSKSVEAVHLVQGLDAFERSLRTRLSQAACEVVHECVRTLERDLRQRFEVANASRGEGQHGFSRSLSDPPIASASFLTKDLPAEEVPRGRVALPRVATRSRSLSVVHPSHLSTMASDKLEPGRLTAIVPHADRESKRRASLGSNKVRDMLFDELEAAPVVKAKPGASSEDVVSRIQITVPDPPRLVAQEGNCNDSGTLEEAPSTSHLSRFKGRSSMRAVVPWSGNNSTREAAYDVASDSDCDASSVPSNPGAQVFDLGNWTFAKTHASIRMSISQHTAVVHSAFEARHPRAYRMGERVFDYAVWIRSMLQEVERNPIFDYTMCCLIVFNAITIGAHSNYAIANLTQDTPAVFVVCEVIFFVAFFLELALRFVAIGHEFFRRHDWRWNMFDCAVVGLQLLEYILVAVKGVDTEKTAMVTGNFNFIRILRILRLIRIIRVFRLLRFVQELRAMVCSIASSFRSLCWTLVLLSLLIYVLGVYFTQVIADTATSRDLVELEDILGIYFGSLPRSLLSLFQAMTGGVDWNDLHLALAEVSPWLSLVLVMYVSFVVFAMMNVVTGVFVESALASAKEDRECEVLKQVRRLFSMSDADSDGKITWEEFVGQLRSPGMDKYFSALDIDISEASALFLLLDADESGEIDMEEFVMGCLRLRGPAKAIDVATLMYFNKRTLVWTRDRMDNLVSGVEVILSAMKDTASAVMELKRKTSSDAVGETEWNNQLTSWSRRVESAKVDDSASFYTSWAEVKAAAHKLTRETLSRSNPEYSSEVSPTRSRQGSNRSDSEQALCGRSGRRNCSGQPLASNGNLVRPSMSKRSDGDQGSPRRRSTKSENDQGPPSRRSTKSGTDQAEKKEAENDQNNAIAEAASASRNGDGESPTPRSQGPG